MTGRPSYLLERGFSQETIARVGWRVEPLGEETRRYGLPREAAGALAWRIPYRHQRNGQVAFERIRLIDEADLERFGGGKYRQPAGRSLELYDPFGVLTADKPVDSVLLVEGEANAVAVYEMAPELAVVGLPGQRALRDDLAEQLGHVPFVYVWLDRDEPGFAAAAAEIKARLQAAGVEEIRFLDAGSGIDANDALLLYGAEGAGRILLDLYEQAKPLGAGDGAALLDELAAFLRRYVVMSSAQVAVVALWIVHTHAIEAAETTPYLSITSAERESGKTRLLEVLEPLVARPWLTGRVTAAVLVRKVDAERPTLLLDESDAAFKGEKEYAEALRGLLNTGYRRSGKASLCVGQGANLTYHDFSTFGAKALAGIGTLPDTVASRAVPVRLEKRAPDEPVETWREGRGWKAAEGLRERAIAWATAHREDLGHAEPEAPVELRDRTQDTAEPLLAIADCAGGAWPERARAALVVLHGERTTEDESIGIRLLTDMRQVFDARAVNCLPTAELLEELHAFEESPWGDWYGKPLTSRALARLLKPYRIRSRTIRLESDETAKGYRRQDLEPVWARYLPRGAPVSVTPSHPASAAGLSEAAVRHTTRPVTDSRGGANPHESSDVTDVTDSDRGNGAEQAVTPEQGNGLELFARRDRE